MWPWEHLAVGYLLYSALARARGDPPGNREAVAVAFGTQFPDLVDKPLAWVFGVSPSGLAGAHSLFAAVPLSLLAILLARRYGAVEVGLAFAVGYLSHPPADSLYPVLLGGEPATWFLLWPLTEVPAPGSPPLLVKVARLGERFVRFLGTPRGILYILGELGLLAAALALWVRDGVPGLPWPGRTA